MQRIQKKYEDKDKKRIGVIDSCQPCVLHSAEDSLILNFRYTNFGIAASSPHPKFKTQKLIQDNQRMLQVL